MNDVEHFPSLSCSARLKKFSQGVNLLIVSEQCLVTVSVLRSHHSQQLETHEQQVDIQNKH